MTTVPLDSAQAAEAVRARLPAGGLFADQHWRVAPAPFALGPELAKELESLGRVLLQFYKAANLLYRQSVAGKQPAWVAAWLDQGKPSSLLELQRSPALKSELPRVLRPDLLLTEDGFSITELDSVPGGIGLTAWLNQTYADLGFDVLGGRDGMRNGFGGIFGDASKVHIFVSEESKTYRPEMEWLCEQLGGERFAVRDANFAGIKEGDAAYRFFEMFDVDNIPAGQELFRLATEKKILLTAPPKTYLEEKLVFALLWNRHLRGFWRQELGEGFFSRLQKIIPYTWVMDPAPLPPHAAIPELGLTDWRQLNGLSQRERNLIIKISGYSPEAWGARGVYYGADMSGADWSAAVEQALNSFAQNPHILQRYARTRLVDGTYHDFATNAPVKMPGRVRLCPYYFVHGEGDAARANLGGVLATICPADKKIIHGMRDAILAPCSAQPVAVIEEQ